MELDDDYPDDSEISAPYGNYDDESTIYVDSEGKLISENPLWDCAVSSISQSSPPIVLAIVFGVIFRILVLKLGPKYAQCIHLFSVVAGGILVYLVFGVWPANMILIFVCLCYCLVKVAYQQRNKKIYFGIVILCLSFMILREYLPVGCVSWNATRGVYMIMVMKTLSVVYELSSGTLGPLPPIIPFLGYLLFPATVLFGPFIPFDVYMNSTDRRVFRINATVWFLSFFEFFTSICYLIGALILSSCVFTWLFLGVESISLSALGSSMSVRFSHYFVSLTSEALLILSGVWLTLDGELIRVVHPSLIEIPRSLVEVVVAWNIPMHKWLKSYIYPPLAHLGPGTAALFTFMVSAMLHGFNFPVSTVLLSLAAYSYIEYSFRKLLGKYYSACIGVRACSRRCNHRNKSDKYLVRLVNFLFTVLALFHLNYLGVMLDLGSYQQQQLCKLPFFENWDFHLEAWRVLEYVSHEIAMCTFMCYLGLKFVTMIMA